eukprot:10556760-Alexandrium_andersonii.AAC.1
MQMLDILGLRLAPSHLASPAKPACLAATAAALFAHPPPPVDDVAQRELKPTCKTKPKTTGIKKASFK